MVARLQAAAEDEEGVVQVLPAFKTGAQPAQPSNARPGALDDRAEQSDPRAQIDAAARDPALNVEGAKGATCTRDVVGLMGVPLLQLTP